MNDQLEKFVQQNRQAFDDLEPDPRLHQRMASQWEPNPPNRIVAVMRKLRWSAAAVVVALAGVGVFHLMQSKPVVVDDAQANVVSKPEGFNQDVAMDLQKKDLTNSTTELVNPAAANKNLGFRKELLISRLSNQGSAGDRYTAASSIAQFKKTDYDILRALVKTMNNDPNTNVRLSALEALSHFSQESFVKEQLIRSLANQTDPIVQISLIELLTEMRERNIILELEKLSEDEQVNEAVRVQAYNSLLKLGS